MSAISARLAQLYALRAQVEALITMEEGAIVELPSGCLHPEEKRVDKSTFGHSRFYCRDCGETVEQAVPVATGTG